MSNYRKKIVSCFDIGEVPKSPGKWNWNWLSFLPFIFSFKQCALLIPVIGIEVIQGLQKCWIEKSNLISRMFKPIQYDAIVGVWIASTQVRSLGFSIRHFVSLWTYIAMLKI